MKLPQGWVEAALRDTLTRLRTGPFGTAVHKHDYVAGGTPLINPMHIVSGAICPTASMAVDEAKTIELADFALAIDDVVLGRRGEMGRCAVIGEREAGWLIGTGSMALTPSGVLTARFLQKYLSSAPVVASLEGNAVGSTMVNLNQSILLSLPIALPPLAEQRRIVAKLDALTARLARARAELDRVPVLAEQLRQAAVVSACSGEMTAAWRDEYPVGVALSHEQTNHAYEHIAGTRRRKAAALMEWRPDIGLPDGWRWASVDEVVSVVQYGTSAKTSDDHVGVPILRMGNIQRGEIDWGSLKYLPRDHEEFPELLLSDGDVLFNRTNSFELVGKSAVFRGAPVSVSFASYLIRVRCSVILPDLLARYLNSPLGRAWVGSVASQQVGQANVNGSKLKSLGIPLPPPEEQLEMVRRLDAVFARADRLEAEAGRARALLDRLEAAILARAFRGELVPQDPNDEPASVLPDRIRARRAEAPKARRGRRTKEDAAA